MIDSFSLGDISPKRDWGYAGDYVEAMWLMVQQENPDDYVVGTGETRSVREFVETALESAELPGDVEQYVKYDKKMYRPAEVDLLKADATKAKDVLGWQPTVRFEGLVELMVKNDLDLLIKQQ